MLRIAFSDVYRYNLPEGHRFPMEKYDLLPEQLIYEGTVSEGQFFTPDKLDRKALELTHTPDYLDKLDNIALSRKEERRIGFPVRKDLVERGKIIAGGTYQCALYALKDGIAMNIAGGTHHAYPDRGEGFCVFNDMAIASKLLLGQGLVNRILFVDLDVHQGNGNAHIFYNDERVFTFSIHGANNYPLKKEISRLDIGVPDRIDDKAYLEILMNALPRIMDQFEPEMVFYQAGVDILDTDKLGRLSVSMGGCCRRDRFVLELCQRHKVPVVVTMGGGYALNIRDIIEAHANTFREAHYLYF